MTKDNLLPPYMSVFSNRIYQNHKISSVCEDIRVVNFRSCWLKNKILDDLLREVAKNAHVLQVGLTFGDEIEKVYAKVNKQGKLDIFDVSDVQISRSKDRFSTMDVNVFNYNATLSWDEKYDVVICYNLLSELPRKTRGMVMDNVLDSLATGGRAIFIDYARQEWWNPMRWILLAFNRLYSPFAVDLQEQPLENFSSKKDSYRWQHTYYGGRLFQKTVATRKILSNEDVRKLTKLFHSK